MSKGEGEGLLEGREVIKRGEILHFRTLRFEIGYRCESKQTKNTMFESKFFVSFSVFWGGVSVLCNMEVYYTLKTNKLKIQDF